MRIDLHNHTPRCNHASGTPALYLARARELGIDVYGFACHAPMAFDEKYRMKLDELESYIAEIRALQKQYEASDSAQKEQGTQKERDTQSAPKESKDKSAHDMKVLCGLEVDFIDGREDLIEPSVLSADLDYLVGSVHFLGEWGFDNPEFIGEYAKRDMHACWEDYLNAIQKMAESGLFQIVGHMDLLKIFGNKMPDSLAPRLDAALESIARAKMSIEINSAGLRKQVREIYPSKAILQKAFALGIPITFGSDAHSLEQVGYGYDKCVALAKSVGYTHCNIYEKKRAISVAI
ncbi:histidinol phosphate phosphatase [Helicobacter sp. CLO-3]|uniref:histidinol-phosphatase n=1 Tax=unclassified Helicobacter TaxID=2593540 RepID=UPI00080572B8|nr:MULTISPECIES: histidinol-phosphatase [unclassified Helicobacter]OBV28871.1 histidinol phosphate phosphatase [Helicobacter sp. CLO-3]OHU84125.1 histidinol phosphate phosphatase [Helicobacter sp. CLO-3]